uniref:Uncharacterized protein n=1 Tax=Timema genevievae TaxID=629358 RepID=A0A7R9K9A1_TIMGE|nr:unnamed protein product [Timema genevievae]
MSGGSYFTRSKARALISNTKLEVVRETSTMEGQVLGEDVDNDTSTTMSLEVSDFRDVDQFHELSGEFADTNLGGQPQGVETEPTTTPVSPCVQTKPPTTNLTPVTTPPEFISGIQQLIIGMNEIKEELSKLSDSQVEISKTRTDLEGQISFVKQHCSQEIEAVKKDSQVSLWHSNSTTL